MKNRQRKRSRESYLLNIQCNNWREKILLHSKVAFWCFPLRQRLHLQELSRLKRKEIWYHFVCFWLKLRVYFRLFRKRRYLVFFGYLNYSKQLLTNSLPSFVLIFRREICSQMSCVQKRSNEFLSEAFQLNNRTWKSPMIYYRGVAFFMLNAQRFRQRLGKRSQKLRRRNFWNGNTSRREK